MYEQHEVSNSLASFPPVDVFVAHNSPRLVHEGEEDSDIGFTAFGTYLARHNPDFFLHGHQRINAETKVKNTRVIGVYSHRVIVIPD